MAASSRLEIAIIGASIGGLAVARALAATGIDARVTILEQRRGARTGQGVLIASNGLAALDRLGLGGAVRAQGVSLEHIEVISVDGGGRARFAYSRLGPGENAMGLRFATLRKLLAERLPANTRLIEGVRATDLLYEGGHVVGVRTTGPDGEQTFPADLVVAADGARSTLRHRLSAQANALQVPEAYLMALGGPMPGFRGVRQYVARGRLLGVFPVDAGTTFLFWMARPEELAALESVDLDALKRLWLRYTPDVEPVLAGIHSRDAIYAARVALVPPRLWNAPNIVLVGDAVHATTPSLAQGANMALVDAVALADAIANRPMDEALSHYAEQRRQVTSLQYLMARLIVAINTTRLPWVGHLRVKTLRAAASFVPSERWVLELLSGLRPAAG